MRDEDSDPYSDWSVSFPRSGSGHSPKGGILKCANVYRSLATAYIDIYRQSQRPFKQVCAICCVLVENTIYNNKGICSYIVTITVICLKLP